MKAIKEPICSECVHYDVCKYCVAAQNIYQDTIVNFVDSRPDYDDLFSIVFRCESYKQKSKPLNLRDLCSPSNG